MTFESQTQSTWDSGTAIIEAEDWELFDPIRWDKTIDKSVGFVGFEAGTRGDFSLSAGYEIGKGFIDTLLPVEVMLNTAYTVDENSNATISVAYNLLDEAIL